MSKLEPESSIKLIALPAPVLLIIRLVTLADPPTNKLPDKCTAPLLSNKLIRISWSKTVCWIPILAVTTVVLPYVKLDNEAYVNTPGTILLSRILLFII